MENRALFNLEGTDKTEEVGSLNYGPIAQLARAHD